MTTESLSKPMVDVDQLLQFMRREHRMIEDNYPATYEKLGRSVYANKTLTYWTVEQILKELDKMHSDQLKLTSLMTQIEIAKDRFVSQNGIATATVSG